jgi:hypothetical protein
MKVRLLLVALAALAAVSCQSAADRERAAFQNRLRQAQPLTREEMARLYDEIARAIGGRTIRMKAGAVTQDLDDKQRAQVLGMLTDPSVVADSGIRTVNGMTLRGINAAGTPPLSEIEANQTLWIDVATFIPRRYVFTFGMPGLGDYAYDLIVQ